MFGADFGTWTDYSREVESKFLQKLSGGKICSVPYGKKMTKAITKCMGDVQNILVNIWFIRALFEDGVNR